MALWFVSYAMSPFIIIVYKVSIVIVYDELIVIVYDVTILLSLTYQFQSLSGKNCLHGSMGKNIDKPSIAI